MLAAFSFFLLVLFPSLKAFTGCCNSHQGAGQVGARTHVLTGNPKQSLPLEKMLEYHLCSHVLLLCCKSNLRFKAICN